MQLQLRTDYDHRTAGIIDAFSQKVLPESSRFSFQSIAKRLQWTIIRTPKHAAASSVIEHCVDRFLEHSFFIPDDDLGRAQLHQFFKPVVPVNDAAIKVVEIRCGKTPSIEWYQRAKLRGDHRDHVQNHPFRLVAGLTKSVDYLQAFGVFDPLQLRSFRFHRSPQFVRDFLDINALEQFLDRFCSHHRPEFSRELLYQSSVSLFI